MYSTAIHTSLRSAHACWLVPSSDEDPTSSQMAASPLQPHRPLPGPPILGLLAGASAFRTAAFLSMGGYHPRFFLGAGETVLALRPCQRRLVAGVFAAIDGIPLSITDAQRRTAATLAGAQRGLGGLAKAASAERHCTHFPVRAANLAGS